MNYKMKIASFALGLVSLFIGGYMCSKVFSPDQQSALVGIILGILGIANAFIDIE